MTIKAILFDKDGTLFDFQASWGLWLRGFVESLTAGDFHLAGEVYEALAFDPSTNEFLPQSPVIAGTSDTSAALIAPFFPVLSLEDLAERIDATAAEIEMAPAADLPRLMRDLKARGLKIGLATNDSEAAARRHLAQAGILPFFDFIAGYDSGFVAKPAPDMLLAFAKAVEIAPEEIVMLGDSLHDLTAAEAAGMPALGILCGVARAEDLAPFAEAVLETPADLPLWLDQRAA